jgi:hypothetical protein
VGRQTGRPEYLEVVIVMKFVSSVFYTMEMNMQITNRVTLPYFIDELEFVMAICHTLISLTQMGLLGLDLKR